MHWIAAPVNSILLILLVFSLVYHSNLGVRVVIEDYVHGPAKTAVLIADWMLQDPVHGLHVAQALQLVDLSGQRFGVRGGGGGGGSDLPPRKYVSRFLEALFEMSQPTTMTAAR